MLKYYSKFISAFQFWRAVSVIPPSWISFFFHVSLRITYTKVMWYGIKGFYSWASITVYLPLCLVAFAITTTKVTTWALLMVNGFLVMEFIQQLHHCIKTFFVGFVFLSLCHRRCIKSFVYTCMFQKMWNLGFKSNGALIPGNTLETFGNC
jgi:hypothetical protein